MSKHSALGFVIVIGIISLGLFGYWGLTQHDVTMEVENVRDRNMGYSGTKSLASGTDLDGNTKIIQFGSPWFIWVNTDELYFEAVDASEDDEPFKAKYHCFGWEIVSIHWYSTCYEKLPLEA